uniref:Uncharacterized protein n=1 Tax=Oreochromis niloticus TaxID=8128 RepID=A0A669ESG2_ORENI
MSATVSKADGVTILTLTSDPNSPWPPLCQILKNLCCSPVCCKVSQHLRRLKRPSEIVLGTLQIMIGLLNVVLGSILISQHDESWTMSYTGYPCWMGGLVIINVILNLTGVAFAIAAIVLYSISVSNIYWSEICEECYGGETVIMVSMLYRSIIAVLIVLSVLELCVTISSVVLGIKSLKSKEKGQTKSTDDPELYKPLLEEDTTEPTV